MLDCTPRVNGLHAVHVAFAAVRVLHRLVRRADPVLEVDRPSDHRFDEDLREDEYNSPPGRRPGCRAR